MLSISPLRAMPHFAPLFAYVHVLCWPILRWQINRLYTWALREGITGALYTVNRWGFLKVVHLADRKDPAAYTPLPRTFRSLTDAGWDSALPACLEAAHPFILPCASGGGDWPHSGQSEGVRRISDCIAIARRTPAAPINSS